MSELEKCEQIGRITVANISPGDTIVITTEKIIPKALCEALVNIVSAAFPENKVIILDGGMQLSVVRNLGEDNEGSEM